MDVSRIVWTMSLALAGGVAPARGATSPCGAPAFGQFDCSARSDDDVQGEWRIYWLDSHHPSFGEPFVGTFADGRGAFPRHARRPDAATTLGRITFQPGDTNTVDWSLAPPLPDPPSRGRRWTR